MINILKSLFSNPFKPQATGDPSTEEYRKRLRRSGLIYMGQGILFMGLVFLADILMSLIFTSGPLFYLSVALFFITAVFALKLFMGTSFVIRSFFSHDSVDIERGRELRNEVIKKYHQDTDYAGGRNHF